MKELISTDDLNLELKQKDFSFSVKWKYSLENTIFLNSDLNLGQFIACDKKGNPLEKPKYYDEWFKKFDTKWYTKPLKDTFMEQYQEAESRVIFEGFKKATIHNSYQRIFNEKTRSNLTFGEKDIILNSRVVSKITDLVGLGIELK